jgi:GDSL-like Lipase/Acylhydrolase family
MSGTGGAAGGGGAAGSGGASDAGVDASFDTVAPADTRSDASPDTPPDAVDARRMEAGSGLDAMTADGDGNGGVDGDAGPLELIHYYGRWNRLTDRSVSVNSGSHVEASFSGTGITANFDVSLNQSPAPTLVWRIDRADWQEGELTATFPLAAGLTAGPHQVLLMIRGLNEQQNRWTPPLVSSITFLGLTVTGGALQPSARPVRPRIEFLGDSVTEGIFLWGSRPGKDSACWRADARLSYAAQTAQALGAEWRQVGFGRQGVLLAGNGGVPTASEAFNWIYQGIPRDSWQPDLVLVNHGTVDRVADAGAFRPAYAAFISTVRAGYPRAQIAALRPFGGYHAAEIAAEVNARRAAGDDRIVYVDTTGWLTASDYTDGIHPNAQGSAKGAAALTAEITRLNLL